MPPPTHKRKASQQTANNIKKTKQEDKLKLKPLGERDIQCAPTDWHSKKDGNCRKDCRACQDEKFECDALNDPDHVVHHLYVCNANGLDSSPTLDQAGWTSSTTTR